MRIMVLVALLLLVGCDGASSGECWTYDPFSTPGAGRVYKITFSQVDALYGKSGSDERIAVHGDSGVGRAARVETVCKGALDTSNKDAGLKIWTGTVR
jgi:hypothetical protein